MTAESELKDEVETLKARGVVPTSVTGALSRPVIGPGSLEQQIAALQADIEALHRGLMLAGRQIEELRVKCNRS